MKSNYVVANHDGSSCQQIFIYGLIVFEIFENNILEV